MLPPTPPKDSPEHGAHQLFTKAVRSLHTRRNAPPTISIPINSTRADVPATPPTPATISLVAVELSNYAPGTSRHDIHALFKGFIISLDYILPIAARFAYPLHTFIWLAG